jgi:uracil-DNA glycosylase
MIAFLSVAAAVDISLTLQKSLLGRALRRHLSDRTGRLLLGGCGSLIQAALKIMDARFEFFHAASLTMHRLEKAVECLPNNFLTHDLYPSSLAGCFFPAVSYVKQCTIVPGLLQV